MVFLATLFNWDYVTASWALLGTFDDKYANSSLFLVALNFATVLSAVSAVERAFTVKMYLILLIFFFIRSLR